MSDGKMPPEGLAAVVARLRELLGYADAVVNDIYTLEMNFQYGAISKEDYVDRRSTCEERLSRRLSSAATAMVVGLEMLGLPRCQQLFMDSWQRFSKADLRRVDWWRSDDDDGLESAPLSFCWEMFRTIETPFETKEVASLRAGLRILENVLESTGKIITQSGSVPRREFDVQRVLHAHLKATFPDFTSTLAISKPVVSFKPDCGIIGLGAAVEFKFVDSAKKFKTAVAGVTEDLSGYAGSKDWVRFYSVVYMTEQFGTAREFHEALSMSGNADRWTTIVVSGPSSSSGAGAKPPAVEIVPQEALSKGSAER